MKYHIRVHPDLEDDLKHLAKKDPACYERVKKKIRIIAENPGIGKPLRNILRGLFRIHIGHFVLIYEFNEETGVIILVKFAHHDQAYT